MTFGQLVEQKLSDGRAHAIKDLLNLVDPPSSRSNLYRVISELRQQLAPRGEDILCVFTLRRTHYRWVRIISQSD